MQTSLSGLGSILAVDDHDIVLAMVSAVLRHAGWKVLPASSAAAAWEILRNASEPPSAVVADVLMPGVDGVAFTEQLRVRMPGIPVLYITGSAEHPLVASLQDRGEHCLLKPFTASELTVAILAVLRGDASHSESPLELARSAVA